MGENVLSHNKTEFWILEFSFVFYEMQNKQTSEEIMLIYSANI